MNAITPQCIWAAGAKLGEGPVWHAGERALYFVDIKLRQLHRCAEDGGSRQSWAMPDETGFALPMADGGLVCGMPGRLMRFDPQTGNFRLLRELEASLPGNRMNDGYVGSDNSLWFGSMDNAEVAPTGSLYRLRSNGELQSLDSGYVITNGPATSPDGATFYHTDTLEKVVYAFDLAEDGSLANKRVFVRTEGSGHPDGNAVDSEGNVWVAMFGGARADCFAPDGRLLRTVAFPCPNVTKIAFGGPDLCTAFATTAWKGMSDEQRSEFPLAGGLFSFRVEVPGLAQHSFTLQDSP
jgi:sugar lactone lactonase YvrE